MTANLTSSESTEINLKNSAIQLRNADSADVATRVAMVSWQVIFDFFYINNVCFILTVYWKVDYFRKNSTGVSQKTFIMVAPLKFSHTNLPVKSRAIELISWMFSSQ